MNPAAEPAEWLEQMVRDFCDAYSGRDLNKLTESFSTVPEAVVFGIGNERRIGLISIGEQFERDWMDSDSALLKLTWCASMACDSAGYVAAEAEATVLTGGQTVKFMTRMTGVAVVSDGAWRWTHWHFSVPGDADSL